MKTNTDLVTFDRHGIFEVAHGPLLDAVTGGGLFDTNVSAQTACGNAECGSYNNFQCGPSNQGCAVQVNEANVSCGANQPCSLINAGACDAGEVVGYQGNFAVTVL